jgi:hypothetical protein
MKVTPGYGCHQQYRPLAASPPTIAAREIQISSERTASSLGPGFAVVLDRKMHEWDAGAAHHGRQSSFP